MLGRALLQVNAHSPRGAFTLRLLADGRMDVLA